MNGIDVLVKQEAGVINFSNFDLIKQQLEETMLEYKEAKFSEESKSTAKAVLADLRKLKKAVNDREIEVKKTFMNPYTEFKTKVKELVELIDQPIELIDMQVQEFEKKQKEKKKEKIIEVYGECIGNMAEYIPLQLIYDTKWENATITIKSIRGAIIDAVDSTVKAVETIKSMNSDAVEKALELYKINLSLTDAITHINNYEAQKQEIIRKAAEKKVEEDERLRNKEIERIREDERKRIEEEHNIREEIKKEVVEEAKQEVYDSFIPSVESQTCLYEYRIELGEEGKKALEMYMDSIGVAWEVI